jgi:uncharacterized membrane protein YjgN (DUF898 family)
MVIVVPFLWVRGMALFPFILVKYAADRHDPALLNHERIHHRQQLEMLILPFYFWYLTEYAIHRLRYRNHFKAYFSISFEKEAYRHEKDLAYLQKRPLWAFLKYV